MSSVAPRAHAITKYGGKKSKKGETDSLELHIAAIIALPMCAQGVACAGLF
jgi:hypothetical protein